MTVTNIILSFLLLILVFVIFPNLRQLVTVGVCFWTWLLCLLLSGLVGMFVGAAIGRYLLQDHLFDSDFGFLQNLLAFYFIVPGAAVLTFVVLYRYAAYSLFSFLERSQKVELARPSVKLGVVVAIFSPLVVYYIISAFKMSR
jgi:hypothetical protein